MAHNRLDGVALASLAFLLFMVFNVFRGPTTATPDAAFSSSSYVQADAAVLSQEPEPQASASIDLVVPPYEEYTLTQGLHGQSYGHLAIDLTAGKGAVVRSPINGVVTQLFVDDLGNTTLVIENERYQVMLLHGIYSVAIGETLAAGQPVGQESNQGNTVDAFGVSCRGRDCGYHTHLNIFDKIAGLNANPLELFAAN